VIAGERVTFRPVEPASFASMRLAVEVDGVPIGTAGFTDGMPELRTVTVYADLDDETYVTDTVRALCRFGFAQLNLVKVEAVVDDRTVTSYEAVGFVREVHRRRARWRDGGWHDEYLLGLLAEELS